MTRAIAAQRLVQLLRVELVGDLLDAIGDRDARDLALKLICRCRNLAVDAEDAAKLEAR